MEVTQSKTELSYLTRSLLHHPSPYIIYELDGSIAWANMAARYIFELKDLKELSISKIDDDIKRAHTFCKCINCTKYYNAKNKFISSK